MERKLHDAKGEFAVLLEQLRKARRISKTELAKLANLTPGYISHLTLGGRTMPSEETVAALASALQLSGTEREQFFSAAGYTGEVRIVTGPLVLRHPSAASEARARVSWGGAPDVTVFYGRQRELATLENWVLTNRCRVVSVLGLGGIGKTSLTARLVAQIKNPFDCVFWRSLKDAPRPESVLLECIQFFSNQPGGELPGTEENQLALLLDLLLECLRTERCVLILDNFESVLQSGERAGAYRPGYEGYGRLLRLVGEAGHRSCLLLTSREKPKEIAMLEGRASLVRSYALQGLCATEGQELVSDRDLFGSSADWASFVELYSGNPLALKLVSELIHEVFGGDITAFLRERAVVFGNVQDLLAEQFERLSRLEQDVMYWLAIEREAVSLDELYDDTQVTKRELLETLNSLRRRSMIEAGGVALFTLQPVILEYVTEAFIVRILAELRRATPMLLESHALVKAQAKDYVRNSQERLILQPVLEALLDDLSKEELEEHLKSFLAPLRAERATGYAAGNILNLLIALGCNLRGSDFAHLSIRQAYLQDVMLHHVNFSYASFVQSTFTDTFGSILALALSPDGSLLAIGTTNSEVRIWDVASAVPVCILNGHQDWVRSVSFSPDGQLLASGGDDRTVMVWDIHSKQRLHTLSGHTNWVRSVIFSPDGELLASGGDDQDVWLWDVCTGESVGKLEGHSKRVCAVAFHPAGLLLASGSDDHTVYLWDVRGRSCSRVLHGHSNGVRAVAFSPDGALLASASDDQTIRLWETGSCRCRTILRGHTNRVRAVQFSPDGSQLASGGQDQTIRLWEVSTGRGVKTLRGHGNWVLALAFHPDGRMLVSGSEDQTVRFWETAGGQCIRLLQGHANWIYSVVFSPDGQLLASSEDRLLRLWEVSSGRCVSILQGHTNWIRSVAYSHTGNLLVSASEDQTVRLWNIKTGNCLRVLQGHTNWIRSVAFSPDERLLASGCDDQTVRLWEVSSGRCVSILQGHSNWIWSVAFSPDGNLLASGGDDQTIRLWNVASGHCVNVLPEYGSRVWAVVFSPDGKLLAGASGGDDPLIWLWEVSTGRCVKTLEGHTSWIRSLTFSPDGKLLASSGQDQLIFVWDIESGRPLRRWQEHTDWVYAVAFNNDSKTLASGSRDGTIKLWNVSRDQCWQTWKSERPYEGMNITGAQGLTSAQRGMLRTLGALEE